LYEFSLDNRRKDKKCGYCFDCTRQKNKESRARTYKPVPRRIKDTSHLLKTTNIDRAYMAGVFDGEGCIVIAEEKKNEIIMSYRLQISVANTDKNLITWIRYKFGGRIQQARTNLYCWYASSLEAGAVLKILLPFLHTKKKRAIIALNFIKIGRGKHAQKKSAKIDISTLNHRRQIQCA